MRLVLITATTAALCVLPAAADESVRHQQGRVLTDSDANEGGDNESRTELISRDAAIAQRKELKPLMERISTRGMRTAEAEYAEELRLWAVRQHARLLELQKIHSAHARLREYRDRVAALGDDTSRIDPRLKGMEDKIRKSSGEIRKAYSDLAGLVERYQSRVNHMSGLMEAQQNRALAIIRNAQS